MNEPGRPRRGDDHLAEIAAAATSDVMRLLGAYAVRYRFTLAGLAIKLDCTPLAVRHFFETRTPRAATVSRVARALGLSPLIERALTDRLDKRDAFNLRQCVQRAVLDRRAIFGDEFAVQDAIVAALDAASLEKRYAALTAFALAEAELKVPTGPGFDLAPELFALAGMLSFDLGAYVVGEARLEGREAEMLAARDWTLGAFAFSADDRQAIETIFARYVKPSLRAPRHALAGAIAEYHRQRQEPATLAGVLQGFTPNMKGTKP